MSWRLLAGGALHGELVLTFGESGDHAEIQQIVLGPSRSPTITLIRGSSVDLPFGQGIVDWVIFDPTELIQADAVTRALAVLKPGGHIAIGTRNRWCLNRLSGFMYHHRLLEKAGASAVRSYAVLPHYKASRSVLPVCPASPPVAQKFAIEQAWRRVSPVSALARHLLGWLVDARVMRFLYPSYLIVGRKPC